MRAAGRPALFAPRRLPQEPAARLFAVGFATAALNPKVALFYMAVLPPFLDAERGSLFVQAAILGATQILVCAAWDAERSGVRRHGALPLDQAALGMAAQRYVLGPRRVGVLAVKARDGGSRSWDGTGSRSASSRWPIRAWWPSRWRMRSRKLYPPRRAALHAFAVSAVVHSGHDARSSIPENRALALGFWGIPHLLILPLLLYAGGGANPRRPDLTCRSAPTSDPSSSSAPARSSSARPASSTIPARRPARRCARGLPRDPGELQPGHDHDRSRPGGRHLHRADHAEIVEKIIAKERPTRCCRPWAARPR
jgi:hypothetical protein